MRFLFSPVNSWKLNNYNAFVVSTFGVAALFLGSNIDGGAGKIISSFPNLGNAALAAFLLSLFHPLVSKFGRPSQAFHGLFQLYFLWYLLLKVFYNSRFAFLFLF